MSTTSKVLLPTIVARCCMRVVCAPMVRLDMPSAGRSRPNLTPLGPQSYLRIYCGPSLTTYACCQELALKALGKMSHYRYKPCLCNTYCSSGGA